MRTRLVVRLFFSFLWCMVLVSPSQAQFSQAVSTIPAGQPPPSGGGGDSWSPLISPDGRYVLFASTANNLILPSNNVPIPAHFPAVLNVYLRDRTNGMTTLVSVNTSGVAGGNGDSLPMGISANGRYALFQSLASDLVAADTNVSSDIFVRDLQTATTFLVSVSTNGSVGNGASRNPVMTPDGRYVAFVSEANNLVAGDTNKIPDIFVRDLQSGTTVLASVGARSINPTTPTGSSESPDITPDGRYVAFFSTATNLVAGVPVGGDVYVRDLVAGTTIWASTGARAALLAALKVSNAVSYNQALSADGQFVGYEVSSGTTPGSSRPGVILRYQVGTGVTDLVHTNATVQAASYEDIRSLDMSPDGRFIVFIANTNGSATTCVQLWDSTTGMASLISGDPNGQVELYSTCDSPTISPTGQFVCFLSSATGLTTNDLSVDYNVYLRDTVSGSLTLINVDTNGVSSSANSATLPVMTADGQFVAFDGDDGTLVPLDDNKASDVFLRVVTPGSTELISVHEPSLPSAAANGLSSLGQNSVSSDGRYVVFDSDADNLTLNDTNAGPDVFVRDLVTGAFSLVSVDTNGFSADAFSGEGTISSDGRYVAFSSSADNLAPGDNNRAQDVFVRDLQTATTTLVSVNSTGTGPGNGNSSAPIIGSDGRYVLFTSSARNLAPGTFTGINLFLRDRQAGATTALTTTGLSAGPSMSLDGRRVAYGTGSLPTTLCVWDATAGARLYTNSLSSVFGLALSPDGRHLAFSARLGTLTFTNYLFLVDLTNSASQIVECNSTNFNYQSLSLSRDGQKLTCVKGPLTGFGTRQVYLFDLLAGATQLASHAYNSGAPASSDSDSPQLSSDGRFVAYRSAAPDLVAGDTNAQSDLFLYDSQTGSNTLLTASLAGAGSGNNRSFTPVFSPDGRTLVYNSWASDLVLHDFNQTCDVFSYGLFYTLLVPATGAVQGPWLTWPYLTGKNYKVQFKNTATDSAWQNLSGTVTNNGSRAWLQDTTPANGQRFYRVLAF